MYRGDQASQMITTGYRHHRGNNNGKRMHERASILPVVDEVTRLKI